MECGEVTAARERERERCDGWEMSRGEGGGRAEMAWRLLSREKPALGNQNQTRPSGRRGRPIVCSSPIASLERRAARTGRRMRGEVRGDARSSS